MLRSNCYINTLSLFLCFQTFMSAMIHGAITNTSFYQNHISNLAAVFNVKQENYYSARFEELSHSHCSPSSSILSLSC